MLKCFIYARKSTDDDSHQIRSIDAQLTELRQFADREGLCVMRELVEAQTARHPGRPIFNAMMDDIESGKASGIIAWHPDRLARNSIDGGRIIYAIDTGRLEALKFPTFWFEDTPQGKFMLQISFGQSKYYVDSLSQNVKRGIREKLRRSEFPGWAPVGYLNDPRKRIIMIDEDKAPLIRKVFKRFSQGDLTVADIHRFARDWGLTGHSGRPIALSRFVFLLSNPFYIGLFRYKGETHQGKHTPIVSLDLFNQVQGVLQKRKRGTYKPKKTFPFRGLLTCEHCGGAITAERQKGHHYYRCSKRKGPCALGYLREETLAEHLRESITQATVPDDALDSMIAEAKREMRDDLSSFQDIMASHRASLSRAEEKLARLLDVYLDGTISREEYNSQKQRLTLDQARLKAKIKSVEHGQASPFEPMLDFLLAVKQAKEDASSSDMTVLRDFHRRIGSNLRLCDPRAVPRRSLERRRELSLNGRILDSASVGRPERTKSEFLFGGGAAGARARKVSQKEVNPPARRSQTSEGGSPHSVVTPCVATKSKSRFSGHSTKRPVPALLVEYQNPWKIFADSVKISNWRRGRDSNPRCPCEAHSISSAAPSATRSPLHRVKHTVFLRLYLCQMASIHIKHRT